MDTKQYHKNAVHTFDAQKTISQDVFPLLELGVVLSWCDISQVIAMQAYSP